MTGTQKISCYIRTQDEERLIESVIRAAFKVCDEVVLVDSGSTDRTREIAEQEGARFIEQDWLGNGFQKRVGEQACRNDWLLDLDADEIVSQELAEEITELFAGGPPSHKAYGLTMSVVTPCGDIWPEAQGRRVKLYDRRALQMPEHKAWDQLKIPSDIKTGRLKSGLLHHAFSDLGHLLQKQNSNSTRRAREAPLKSRTSLTIRILLGLPFYFVRQLIHRNLWNKGLYAFAYSMVIAFGRWLRDVKMLERHLNKKIKN